VSRVPALVVMHGELAHALVGAAARLYGPVDDVLVMSNEGHSRDTLEHEIAERVAHWREGGLVLTDVWGGSCHVCGALAARGHGDVVVLTGINLPTLVDYLHNRDKLGVQELADRLLHKGQESIRLQRGAPR
jgi:mannose/fructose-specific phosphotransferase system component IIA